MEILAEYSLKILLKKLLEIKHQKKFKKLDETLENLENRYDDLARQIPGTVHYRAAKGEVFSQVQLGWSYMMGHGCYQNYEKARYWYEWAAELGDARAQFNLGFMHLKGLGAARNVKKARELFILAAKQGNTGVLTILGFMCARSKDYVQSYKWLSIACTNKDMARIERFLGAYMKKKIANKITESEREKARKLAQEFIQTIEIKDS